MNKSVRYHQQGHEHFVIETGNQLHLFPLYVPLRRCWVARKSPFHGNRLQILIVWRKEPLLSPLFDYWHDKGIQMLKSGFLLKQIKHLKL